MKKIVLMMLVLFLVGLSGCAIVSSQQAFWDNAIPENRQVVAAGVVKDGDLVKNAVLVRECKVAPWYKRLFGADRCEPSEKDGRQLLIVF